MNASYIRMGCSDYMLRIFFENFPLSYLVAPTCEFSSTLSIQQRPGHLTYIQKNNERMKTPGLKGMFKVSQKQRQSL